jgi:hypothetical protein
MDPNLFTGIGVIVGGIIGFFISQYFHKKDDKWVNEMKNAIRRIGQLSSQSKGICKSLDLLEDALKQGKIGANSAEKMALPIIKANMEAFNGELEAIYNEYIKN